VKSHQIRKTATVLSLVLSLAVLASPAVVAQKTMSDAAMATANATIQAIDSTNRLVTLTFDDGTVDTMYAGPEVKRFNELKVGDKVSFRYHESLVLQLKKTTAPPSAPTIEGALTRGTGPKPSGTYSRQMKATVVVEAIDMALPSITVKTAAGAKVTYKVEDKKNLEGVAVGDHVEITYTQALVISVEEPKK
jgi:Cu/Ag efflux protein CusF